MDDGMPSTLTVEYCYARDNCWRLSQVSEPSLASFKQGKYELWKKQITEPDCMASLKRLLQIGHVTTVFDKALFPLPKAWEAEFKVKDPETGKVFDMPCPVSAMRVWDTKQGNYRAISSKLDNLPANEDAAW